MKLFSLLFIPLPARGCREPLCGRACATPGTPAPAHGRVRDRLPGPAYEPEPAWPEENQSSAQRDPASRRERAEPRSGPPPHWRPSRSSRSAPAAAARAPSRPHHQDRSHPVGGADGTPPRRRRPTPGQTQSGSITRPRAALRLRIGSRPSAARSPPGCTIRAQRPLRAALTSARRAGLITHNPAQDAELARAPRYLAKTWTAAEAKRFLVHSKESGDRNYTLWRFLLATGTDRLGTSRSVSSDSPRTSLYLFVYRHLSDSVHPSFRTAGYHLPADARGQLRVSRGVARPLPTTD